MVKSTDDYILGVLDDVITLMREFEDVVTTVTKQKPFQMLDYQDLYDRLEIIFKDARDIEQELKAKKVEINNFDTMLADFRIAIDKFGEMFDGLKAKADATGRYGWFQYRKDLNAFWEAYGAYQASRLIFGNNIKAQVNDPDETVEVTTMVLDPKESEPIEEVHTYFKSDYEGMSKDKNGVVYIIRTYEEGQPKDISAPKKYWDEAKDAWR